MKTKQSPWPPFFFLLTKDTEALTSSSAGVRGFPMSTLSGSRASSSPSCTSAFSSTPSPSCASSWLSRLCYCCTSFGWAFFVGAPPATLLPCSSSPGQEMCLTDYSWQELPFASSLANWPEYSPILDTRKAHCCFLTKKNPFQLFFTFFVGPTVSHASGMQKGW